MTKSSSTPPGPQHTDFTAWAQSRGVAINGIKTAQIAGRGLGICASRKIKAGEELIKVPTSVLFTSKSTPASFREMHHRQHRLLHHHDKGDDNVFTTISTHGLLASYLAFGDASAREKLKPWMASWPSMQDFQSCMPMLWPAAVRDEVVSPARDDLSSSTEQQQQQRSCFPLPPAIGGRWSHPKMQSLGNASVQSSLLYKQEERFNTAWAIVSAVFPDAEKERYMYYWLVVNSRSFYWEFDGETPPKSHDDRMVLVPWADYFNHSGAADDGCCNVSFDKDGYTISSDRAYGMVHWLNTKTSQSVMKWDPLRLNAHLDVGEELYTSYGNHSNDFLLVEYGFTTSPNHSDTLPLDDFFLHTSKKTQLQRANYWGNYTLNPPPSPGICHRTKVAVRAQTTNLARWKQFVAGREIDKEREELKADTFIAENILRAYYESAKAAVECLEEMELRDDGDDDDDGGSGRMRIPEGVRSVLVERWKQIGRLVKEAFVSRIHEQTQARMRDVFDVGGEEGVVDLIKVK